MNRTELEKLVLKGEGEKMEFKLKANHPDKIVRGVLAFANTNGGVLFIGVDDNRNLIGCKNPEEEVYVMESAIEKYCAPVPQYFLDRIDLDDERQVLMFRIPESGRKPHYYRAQSDKLDGTVFIRVKDQTMKASREMKEVLKGQTRLRFLKLQYGDKEKKLLEYLKENTSITVSGFAQLAGLTKKIASRTLVFLAVMNLLEIIPGDQEDEFRLKEN